MMYKTQKEQQKKQDLKSVGLIILLILIWVSLGYIDKIGSDTNRERVVSYTTQLESLAVSKGYTMEDKVTYKERQHLGTEEGRYVEFMKYLEGVEVSEREFQEIKDIQSNFEKIVNVNEIGKNDYDNWSNILIVIAFIVFMILLTAYALI